MTSRDFCYWLQGFFEIMECPQHPKDAPCVRVEQLSVGQTAMIRQHLAMVFAHEIDPSHGNAEMQAKLNAIHNPGDDASGVKYRC